LGLNASGFTVEGPWQARSIVSGEVVGWWMLDLATATANDIIASPAEMLLKLLLVGLFLF